MQTRTALKRLSKGQIDVDRVSPGGPLAQNAEWLLKQHEQRTADVKTSQRRHAYASAMPVLEAARNKAEAMLRDDVMPNDTPIVSRFDAFSVVKDASRKNPEDMGLRKMSLHLERLWHAGPLDALTVGALSRIRDHYQNNSPRSIVGEIIDTVIPKVSFKTLPVAKLVRIASQISTQEDYDTAVERNGLHGDDPISVRARTFIRELANRSAKLEVGSTPKNETKGITEMKALENKRAPGIKRLSGKDIAERVASTLSKFAEDTEAAVEPSVEAAAEPSVEAEVEAEEKKDDMGVGGTGVLARQASKDAGLRHEALLQLAASGDKLPSANFDPKINAQQPDQVAVPSDGVEALESDSEFKQVRKKAVFGKEMDMAKELYSLAEAGSMEASKLVDLAEQKAPEVNPDAVGKLYQQSLPLDATRAQEINIMMVADPSFLAKAQAVLAKERKELLTPPKTPGRRPGVQPVGPAAPMAPAQPAQQPAVAQQPAQWYNKPPNPRVSAITPDHPLVDDGGYHFPIGNFELAAVSRKTAQSLTRVPAWWLGSVDELKKTVVAAIERRNKEAKLPPGLEKHKFPKKTDKKDKKGPPWKSDKSADEKCALKLDKDTIGRTVVAGQTFKAAGYSILIDKDDIVSINTKTGSKKYALVDFDSAIADFMYLASTSKHPAGSPPPPMFFIREGLRLQCPGCSEINSYGMPKTAASLTCSSCHVIIPAKVVAAALESGTVNEEVTLIAVTPTELQDTFGDKFAAAAEIIGADGVGADGCRAEAYAVDVPTEKLAEVWDFMVNAGFKPIAQELAPIDEEPVDAPPVDDIGPETLDTHEMEEGDEMAAAERLEDISEEIGEIADELQGMEHHGQSGPVPPSTSAPSGGVMAQGPEAPMDMGEGMGLGGSADEEVVKCAMTHYKNTGLGVVDAIGQFQKDYMKEKKDETGNITASPQFEQSLIVKMAAEIYGLDAVGLGTQMELGMAEPAPEMAGPEVEAPVAEEAMGGEAGGTNLEKAVAKSGGKAKARKVKKADIPLPKVNQQQPDAVTPGKLGPDTDQKGSIPTPGKIKNQTGKPQGNFAPTKMEEDSDNRDPSTFSAGSPKAQHPATDQRGTSLPSTDLGTDSDTGDNAVTKDMISKSKNAPNTIRSK